jgi:hypothetical protein
MPRIPASWPALWRAAAALLVAGAALVAGPLSAQARPLPVNYDFATGALVSFLFPQTPPPGADNIGCQPSSAHPDPVILVNGTFANQDDNWQAASPLLANHGYCVFTFNYGGSSASSVVPGTGDIAASAGQLASFVTRVRAATGAAGLVNGALNALCTACVQQEAGSAFLGNLNAGGDTEAGVSYTVIESRNDEVVTPYTSAFVLGPVVPAMSVMML